MTIIAINYSELFFLMYKFELNKMLCFQEVV